jgi:hypothetical protein
MMHLLRTIALSGALLLATSACQSSRDGKFPPEDFPLSASLRTKADIYRTLGLPNSIRDEKDGRIIRYQLKISKGLGLGLGVASLMLLRLSHDHNAIDTIEFRLDKADRVLSVTSLTATPELSYRLWPFGS